MFNLELPFKVQGVAKFLDNKLIIGDCQPFKEVDFNSNGAYIRETGFETATKSVRLECDEYEYKITKEYAFVYFDFVNKYTLDSVRKTVLTQLNQKSITIKSIKSDFVTVKTEENLSIKDACLLKITFDSIEDFYNDCDGLVCQC